MHCSVLQSRTNIWHNNLIQYLCFCTSKASPFVPVKQVLLGESALNTICCSYLLHVCCSCCMSVACLLCESALCSELQESHKHLETECYLLQLSVAAVACLMRLFHLLHVLHLLHVICCSWRQRRRAPKISATNALSTANPQIKWYESATKPGERSAPSCRAKK
jgi:hypothetical protein